MNSPSLSLEQRHISDLGITGSYEQVEHPLVISIESPDGISNKASLQ